MDCRDVEELQKLKAEHDRIWREGEAAFRNAEECTAKVNDLRKQIEDACPGDYDGVWMLFNGTFGDTEPESSPNGADGASGALERVIAEQQKVIDRLRLDAKSNLEARARENERVAHLATAAFVVLNYPESREFRVALKQAVVALGFCPVCESRPCECQDDD